MSPDYYSDRLRGSRPRTVETIDETVWGGIVGAILSLVGNNGFAGAFPEMCRDGEGTCGTADHQMGLQLRAEIPGITWPLDARTVPDTLDVLDLLEFCHRHVGVPTYGRFHSYFGHSHITSVDRDAGRAAFRETIETIFARNGVAYELREDGMVRRLVEPVVAQALGTGAFQTGDSTLDDLLLAAVTRFLDPRPDARADALEKLWDAWERIKTLESTDKKVGIAILISKAATNPALRDVIDADGTTLTGIGNSFRIRHSESTQIPLETALQVDYLFHRMFGLIHMLLRAR